MVFKGKESQPFIVGDDNLEIVSETVEEVSPSKGKDETQHSNMQVFNAHHLTLNDTCQYSNKKSQTISISKFKVTHM